MILLLLACTPKPLDSDIGADSAHAVTETRLAWSTAPELLVAGEEGTFTLQITDQDGHPVEDLQQNHERMVHTMFVSADWTSFTHAHHEDYAELSADDLREATFQFPLTLPVAGDYYLMFGWAHQNQWLYDDGAMTVSGAPEQLAEPDTTVNTVTTADDLTLTLTWTSPPIAGYEASWTVTVTDGDGAPVEDLTQYLGADAHCALVNERLTWGSHTHAWFPGIDSMTPGMEMPQIYTGPDVSFVYAFPYPGTHKIWVQLARESAPGVVYTGAFVFEVSG